VCHGAADSLVPDDDVANFKLEMKDAQADMDFVAYEGALHGFTSRDANDNGKKYGLPLAYDEIADQESWQAMKDLFNQVL
jgi:dienelactone hydrolase